MERGIDRLTSISGTGSYGILHFLDSNQGQDSSQISGMVALNRRLNARNTLSVSAIYEVYDYSGGIYATQPSTEIRGINGIYERLWTRALTTSISVGPQWIGGYTLTPSELQYYPLGTNPVIPGRVTVGVSATASYSHQRTSGGVGYTRGFNGGSGVQPGATADTVFGQISRSFGRDWGGALSGTVARTVGLTGGTATQTYNFSAQLTRRITRHLSAYVSDSVQHQSIGSLVGSNAFSGLANSASIGISWAPRSTRLNQF